MLKLYFYTDLDPEIKALVNRHINSLLNLSLPISFSVEEEQAILTVKGLSVEQYNRKNEQ